MVKSIDSCPVFFNLLDLSGSIKACKDAALKCDELNFEQYKLSAGDPLTADTQQHMQNCLEKIRLLEHQDLTFSWRSKDEGAENDDH